MNFLKHLPPGLIALAIGATTSAHGQSIDELYTAAKKEGALSLMGGGPAELYEPGYKNSSIAFLASR